MKSGTESSVGASDAPRRKSRKSIRQRVSRKLLGHEDKIPCEEAAIGCTWMGATMTEYEKHLDRCPWVQMKTFVEATRNRLEELESQVEDQAKEISDLNDIVSKQQEYISEKLAKKKRPLSTDEKRTRGATLLGFFKGSTVQVETEQYYHPGRFKDGMYGGMWTCCQDSDEHARGCEFGVPPISTGSGSVPASPRSPRTSPKNGRKTMGK
eukprot:GFYU01022176.1.p1 GENE.GFYU01022176.1~~GFYU01022176.1.p1  ORF type:complete len:210 (-),score=2.62 GFYU01022176.1:61-690(-)